MFSEVRRGELVYLTAPLLPMPHAFTTRYGGVSEGVYAGLNLGESRGDDIDNVRENYRLIKAALGIDKLCFTHQIHESKVRYVTRADAREPGDATPPDCDGLVTDEEGLALIIFIADCAPILLCDEKRRIIAAAHAGWRGTVADIAGKVVESMAGLGSDRRDIRAAIGPCISKCCFETGPEIPEAVMNILGEAGAQFIAPSPSHAGKYMVDLKGVNRALLIRAGLRPENIEVSDACTACESQKFWSHRASGAARGSQAAIIVNRRA